MHFSEFILSGKSALKKAQLFLFNTLFCENSETHIFIGLKLEMIELILYILSFLVWYQKPVMDNLHNQVSQMNKSNR